MTRYITKSVVKIKPEKIWLSDNQVARRQNILTKAKTKGCYVPLAELTFKAGEIIGLDSVSKSLLRQLEVIEADQ